jgi:hypothetical protein
MRYHEIVEAKEITPGLRKSKKLTLKDGRTAIMVIQHVPEDPTRTEQGYERVTVTIHAGDEYIGGASFSRNSVKDRYDAGDYDGTWSAENLVVNRDYQRQGLATEMYDFATKCGMRIVASGRFGGKLTPDGNAFWSAQRPSTRLGQKPKPPSKYWKRPKRSA